jgi:hypothetical protein
MRKFLAVILVAGALAACTTHDVLNIDNAPIGVNGQSQDVGAVIETALRERGWQVAARRPGAVDAFIAVRQHRADITVSYTQTSYSIAYRGSEGLDYRGGKIHRNYNRWIANLNTDIQRTLGSLPPA